MAFAYYASDGAIALGAAHAESGALVFEEHTYVGADGATQRMRSRWVFEGPNRFVVSSDVMRDGVWVSWGRISYTRTAAAAN